MEMRQRMKRLSAIGLTVVLCLAVMNGCQSGGEHDNPLEAWEAPYDNPVTLRIAYSYSDIELPEGEMGDDNFMLRYLREKTGVAIRYDWEAGGDEQYNSMMDLAIRSNDLPDAFLVNREQFRMLMERHALADLSEIYPRYASPLVQSIYEATEGKALMEEAMVDGNLYALPNVAIEADAPTYIWVRQDWLDQLSLPAPRTLEDIALISKAFQERDPDGNGHADTVGIPVDKTLLYNQKTGVYGLDAVFASFHAFPRSWIRNEQGHIVYGSIQPEAKQALELLAEWYRDGVIDQEFMLRKESNDLMSANRAGLIFAPWWAPYYPLNESVAADTKAEWRVYTAPLDSAGRFVTRTAPVTDRYLVVRKDYPHPEAALKVLNVLTSLERNVGPEDEATQHLRKIAQQIGNQLRNYYPFDLLLDYPDSVVQRHDLLLQAQNGEVAPEELDPDTRRLYDNLLMETERPRKDMEAWSTTQAYMLGGAVSKKEMHKVESLFHGSTPAIREYGEQLQKLEHDVYLKIITGELPVDAFDSFVEDWLDGGGRKIMREVSEWIEERDGQEGA